MWWGNRPKALSLDADLLWCIALRYLGLLCGTYLAVFSMASPRECLVRMGPVNIIQHIEFVTVSFLLDVVHAKTGSPNFTLTLRTTGPETVLAASCVLLVMTCSPCGLAIHMQIFEALKYLILQKNKFSKDYRSLSKEQNRNLPVTVSFVSRWLVVHAD